LIEVLELKTFFDMMEGNCETHAERFSTKDETIKQNDNPAGYGR
jgi:hypothetical protein